MKAAIFIASVFVSISLVFGWLSPPQDNKKIIPEQKQHAQTEIPVKAVEKPVPKPQQAPKIVQKEIPVVDTQTQKNNVVPEKKVDSPKNSSTPEVAEKSISVTRKGGKGDASKFFLYVGNSKYFQNFKYVGNSSKKSMIYHLPTCKDADKIKKVNMVKLASKEEAEKKGFRPCLHCKP